MGFNSGTDLLKTLPGEGCPAVTMLQKLQALPAVGSGGLYADLIKHAKVRPDAGLHCGRFLNTQRAFLSGPDKLLHQSALGGGTGHRLPLDMEGRRHLRRWPGAWCL